MKQMWKYVLLGCAVALGGLFFSDLCCVFLNGLDYGSASVLGMAMYLCVVVVTCTGVLLSRTPSKPPEDVSDQAENG